MWLALITSGELVFEREVIEQSTIDIILLPAFDDLTQGDLASVDDIFLSLARKDQRSAWERVDEWVTRLYGLSSLDLETINDTLEFNLPFAENRS